MKPQLVYRGDRDQLRRVLERSLRDSSFYRRAVGFFSSSVFSVAPAAFRTFFSRGGRMEVVCCPRLIRSDVEAYIEALIERPLWHSRAWPTPNESTAREFLSVATARGQLSIRIALVVRADSTTGIYHEKIGVFGQREVQGGAVGSANESRAAYLENFERVHLFLSQAGKNCANLRLLEANFDELWENKTAGLRVVPLHEAFEEGLLEVVHTDDMDASGVPEVSRMTTLPSHAESEVRRRVELLKGPENLIWPSRLHLRPYQESAIEKWFDAGGQGILAMATGSGKTLTALGLATRLYERVGGPLVLAVVAPYLVLVDQWIEKMREFGMQPIRCAEGTANWRSQAQNTVFLANQGRRQVTSLVCTNATFRSEPFQAVLKRLQVRTLLIADEVHNLGAKGLLDALPAAVSLRLGLSATPERKWDTLGTTALEEYFGRVIYRFTLRDALRCDPPALCPYDYHPILVSLDDDEIEEYRRLSQTLAKLLGDANAEEPSENVERLLIRRARILASARQKLPALRETIRPFASTPFNLVYCGDGLTDPSGLEPGSESDDALDLSRQIEAVVQLLGESLGMRAATYTADTPRHLRRELLEVFREGTLQALVAIRCLDEGVDIPDVRRAFLLASSSNPRQFVQRRGRVLRNAPGKAKASIYDFFVVPPSWSDRGTASLERRLVRREMERAIEFLSLASNATAARHRLLPVLKAVDSLDLLMGKGDQA